MKRTTLWNNRSAGLVVAAAALSAVAMATILFTQRTLGQPAGERTTEEAALSRKEVSELLAQARIAIREGRLDAAEEIVSRTERAAVDFPLFYPGDTPKKVRRSLEEARPAEGTGETASTAAIDPFAHRDRGVAQDASHGADVAGQIAYPGSLHPGASAGVNAQGRLPDPYAAGQSEAAGADEAVQFGHSQSPQVAAAMSTLRSARLALAVGDTHRARQSLQEAKSLGVGLPNGTDSPSAVESAIVRYEQLMAERQTLGSEPAWRRQYGTILCEQATVLVDYHALDEAERLVTDAARLGASFGPYDVSPQEVMQKITLARKAQSAAEPLPGQLSGQAAPPAPDHPAKEHALRLLAAARAALAAGDIRQAESLVADVAALSVPADQFAPGEDHPTLVAVDIQKAKMSRAQRRREGDLPTMSAERPELALEVQQSLYTPETDTTGTIPAAGSEEPPFDGPRLSQNVHPPAPLVNTEAAPVQSKAEDLLQEGEAALREGDADRALQLFQSAYAERSELDPLAVQRLQGHLQMLSTGGTPTTTENPSGSLIDSVTQAEQVAVRQLSAELTQKQSDARRIRETDPKHALELLEAARENIKKANVAQNVKAQLLRRVELSISDTENYIQQNSSELDLDAENREILAEIERRRQARLDMQQRIAELVDQFNQLQEEQRFEEMEIVAQRLYELAPEEPVAQTAWTTAKMYRRSKLNQMLLADKEESVWATFQAVEDAAVPFDDSNPFQHGDAQSWQQLTRSRNEQRQRRNRLNERELEIQRKLRMGVQVNYVNRPLQEVFDELSRVAGISIHLDEHGMAQENVRSDVPVTLTLNNEISLKSVLNLILDPLHLDYIIQDEVLKITSEQRAQGAVYPEVYDVGDLVIPIPNFVPDNNIGLQGLINHAHSVAGGNWLGGPGPVAMVNNDTRRGGTTITREVMAQQQSPSLAGIPGPGAPAVPISSGPAMLGGGAAADFDSLIQLITSTVSADSWDAVGGPGSIQPFPTNLSLVISQTQQVHEEIADLLEQLRRLQDLQVTIEVRFITLSDSFFEQIGVDFDFLLESGPADPLGIPTDATGAAIPGGRVEGGRSRTGVVGISDPIDAAGFPNWTSDLDVPFTQESFDLIIPQFGSPVGVAQFGFAILSDLEAYFVIQAAQGDRRSNILEAPKVTLFNGQQAFVNDTTSRPFVISVIPVVGDFAAAQQPVIVVLSEGTMLSIQAVVSDDRRYVRLTVVPFFSQIGEVEEFTFEGSTTTTTGSSSTDDDDDGNNEEQAENENVVRTGTTVQLPTFSQVSVATAVSVPDGGTVLLGGIKRMSEGRNEFGVPLLSKIPYVNRLFRNVGIGRQTQSLMMMVTPRIIIQEEEEARLLGTGP